MIRLGIFITPQYPNSGIKGVNRGTIVFKGRMACGANSTIFAPNGNSYIEFGDNFGNVTTLRLNCDYRIVFGTNVRIGWDVTIMDSLMHRIKSCDGNYLGRGYDEVIIGNDNWISTNCLVLSGVKTPNKCIFSARSVLNKDYSSFPSYSLFAGVPATLKKTGVWRDVTDDVINYIES
jgi:acetyltransferase-like isoleucine patch superfamily enzyme